MLKTLLSGGFSSVDQTLAFASTFLVIDQPSCQFANSFGDLDETKLTSWRAICQPQSHGNWRCSPLWWRGLPKTVVRLYNPTSVRQTRCG